MEGKNKDCPCQKHCLRHGKCAACREHHRQSKSVPLPACERLQVKAKAEVQTQAQVKTQAQT